MKRFRSWVWLLFIAGLFLPPPSDVSAKDAPTNKRAKVEPLQSPRQFTITPREQLVWALSFRKTIERAQKPIDFMYRWSWDTDDLVMHQCIDEGRDKWKAMIVRSEQNYRTMLRSFVKKQPKKRNEAGNALAIDHLHAIFLDQELQKCGLRPLLRMTQDFRPSPLFQRLRKRWTSR